MTPISASQVGTGRSPAIAVDQFTNPFNVGVGVTITGTVTVNIEISFDDPMDAGYVEANANWFAVSGFSALSSSVVGAIVIPCKAISINQTAGTGTTTIKIGQAGIR